jgi:Ca2+-dependent lipid-binding protein
MAAPTAAVQAGVAAVLMSGGTESVEFLNEIMAALQPYLRVAVSAMVKEMVEPMFKETLPGPLKTLHFVKVDLGATPFRFSAVDVHKVESGTNADSLKFDMDVNWDGDMDVELDADLVPGFGVQHVKFAGRLSVLLRPLISRLPLISAMQVALINPPELELDFTGAAQALDLSVIDDTIRGIIKDIVGSILVLPNRLLIKVDPLSDLYLNYLDPLGFIRVKVESGSGFKAGGGFIKDVPDTYCAVKFGANKPWHTSTKSNDETPEWMEEHDFLISDHDQLIVVEVWDSDVGSDTNLGSARITAGELLLAGKRATLPLIPHGAKEANPETTVTISCQVFDLVADATSLEAPPVEGAHTSCGLVTILVAGAHKLVGARADLSTQVAVTVGDKAFATGIVADVPGVDVNNPCFDVSYRVPLTPELVAAAPDVKFTLKNKGAATGEYSVAFADVLAAPGLAIESDFPVESGGSLRAKVYISGLSMHVDG